MDIAIRAHYLLVDTVGKHHQCTYACMLEEICIFAWLAILTAISYLLNQVLQLGTEGDGGSELQNAT